MQNQARSVGLLWLLSFCARLVVSSKCAIQPQSSLVCEEVVCWGPTSPVIAVPRTAVPIDILCQNSCAKQNDLLLQYDLDPVNCVLVLPSKLAFYPTDLNMTVTKGRTNEFQFTLQVGDQPSEFLIKLRLEFDTRCIRLKASDCSFLDKIVDECVNGCEDLSISKSSGTNVWSIDVQVVIANLCPCSNEQLGNGQCDPACNWEVCDFDGQDCIDNQDPSDDSIPQDEDSQGINSGLLVLVIVCFGASSFALAMGLLTYCRRRTEYIRE